MITRPMLAAHCPPLEALRYPVLVTPKIDGIRCLKVRGRALSRSFKPIPNRFIRDVIEAHYPDGVDGELLLPGKPFFDSSSAIMSREGEPNFKYAVFDFVTERETPYRTRVQNLAFISGRPGMERVMPELARTPQAVEMYEESYLTQGYEGIILRAPDGPYKCGRSTVKEGYLLKLKRFQDGEAIIVGFEELRHNLNPQTESALGFGKRSTHQENMAPAGTLGALVVTDLTTRAVFSIGTGFSDALRALIWGDKPRFMNRIVKYKFQAYGGKDLPRQPVFQGFRSPKDL